MEVHACGNTFERIFERFDMAKQASIRRLRPQEESMTRIAGESFAFAVAVISRSSISLGFKVGNLSLRSRSWGLQYERCRISDAMWVHVLPYQCTRPQTRVGISGDGQRLRLKSSKRG